MGYAPTLAGFQAAVAAKEGWGTVSQIARDAGLSSNRGIMDWALNSLKEGGGTFSQVNKDVSQAQADEAAAHKQQMTKQAIEIGAGALAVTAIGTSLFSAGVGPGGGAAGGVGAGTATTSAGTGTSLFPAAGSVGSFSGTAGLSSGIGEASATTGTSLFGLTSGAGAAAGGASIFSGIGGIATGIGSAVGAIAKGAGKAAQSGAGAIGDFTGFITKTASGAGAAASNLARGYQDVSNAFTSAGRQITAPLKQAGSDLSTAFAPITNSPLGRAVSGLFKTPAAQAQKPGIAPAGIQGAQGQSVLAVLKIPILIGLAIAALFLLKKKGLIRA